VEKLAVAFINHKGGVGKTSLANIMIQIGLSENLRVTAVDLDPQKNLSDALFLARSANHDFFSKLDITNSITDTGDFIVVDCPPALNDLTAAAIEFADITLVPVMADLFSVANLGLVYKFAQEHEKSAEQTAIIKVGFDKRALVDMISSSLGETEYCVAGDVPINRLIPYNVTMGNIWEYRTSKNTREPYYELYNNLWRAYKKMLDGDFQNAWKDKK